MKGLEQGNWRNLFISGNADKDCFRLDTQLATAHEETALEGETEEPANVEHHFICYVEKDGELYEIDSCAPFPRSLGQTSGGSLLSAAGKHVKKLMEDIGDASFSAMALVKTA
ncbi:unnamed protein product [Strongylus vulgaris]|uniref:UCH catalytic domain-containing protein n=1 Tax=Strongylus vulgaris TaxID=40348 RepID=A0A3P7J8C9_STRVU|nr:unnamed protein product [Strongylus vulgaris]